MGDITWLLLNGGLEADVYDADPVTRRLSHRKRLKFTRRLTPEEALKVINTNFPKPSDDVRMAADYLGQFKKGK
jgi:hypothetical protein